MTVRAVYFLKSLRTLYLLVLSETIRGLRLNVWHYVIHLGAILATTVLLAAVQPIPGLLGEIFSGTIFGIFLSVYLASVSAAVSLERVSAREVLIRSWSLLPRVLAMLFIFFLITFAIHFVVRKAIVVIVCNLIIAVTWNAVVESTYLEDEVGWEVYLRAWRFVYDNTIEWFVPIFAFAALVAAGFGLTYAARALILFLATHPLQFLQMLLAATSHPSKVLAHAAIAAGSVLILYPAFIFRGLLYKHMRDGNRRKRIFEAQF